MSSDLQANNRRGYVVGSPVVRSEALLENALQFACLSVDVRQRETSHGHTQTCQLSSSSDAERCTAVNVVSAHTNAHTHISLTAISRGQLPPRCSSVVLKEHTIAQCIACKIKCGTTWNTSDWSVVSM